MTTENFRFVAFDAHDILQQTKVRSGEQKIGEAVFADWNSPPLKKYVLIGVAEDIGPQANYGQPGAKNAFHAFLPYFLNMQSNQHYFGDDIACWGYVEQLTEFSSVETAQNIVHELDQLLIELLIPIFEKNQIPILIGGGHNNAYPLIHAFNKVRNKRLSVVNLDPHADCRTFNGRHSGNSFSLALHRQEILHYSVLGLHRPYNNEWTYNFLDEHHCFYTHFDDYILHPKQLKKDIQKVFNIDTNALGIELDLDSIKNMPSSARTPSGFSIEQARLYVRQLAQQKQRMAYFHLPEGAPTNAIEKQTVGKTLAYFVYDFLATKRH